jgi:asparagine synthase (glutamine-hydrolysing)
MRLLDLEFFLPGDLLVKMDRATMGCSLEARSPFLDHRLLEWAAKVPTGLLLHGWRTKALLRGASRGILPRAVRRGPKRGFEPPLEVWLAGPWRAEVARTLEDPTAALREVVDGRALAPWLEWERMEDRTRAARSVFTLLTLEHWLRRWG